MNWKRQHLVKLIIFLWSGPLWGDLFEVTQETPVYHKPHLNSEVSFLLSQGDRVILKEAQQGFYHLSLIGSVEKTGYIPVAIKGEALEKYGLRGRSLGVGFVSSSLQQGSRIVETQIGSTEISILEGSALFPMITYEFPWRENIYLRPYIVFRSIEMKGFARAQTSVSTSMETPVKIQHALGGGGVTTQFHLTSLQRYWWGLSLESSWAYKVLFEVDGKAQDVQERFPIFLSTSVHIGMRYQVGRLQIHPEFRWGGMLNTQPMISNTEFLLLASFPY